MLIIRSWLEELIELKDLDDEALAHTLTHLGLEVEAVQHLPGFDPLIVVGEVQAISAHPQADKLQLAAVKVGDAGVLEIVCGAINLALGMKVAVARVGAKLPGGMKIKATKIRSVASAGMILAADELGLTPLSQAGIMPLGDEAVVGDALEHHYPFAESIFDLAITPNRGDCLSYVGIARDLAAKLRRPYQKPTGNIPDELPVPVLMELCRDEGQQELSADMCMRYMAVVVQGVAGHSAAPIKMQRRLGLSGVRPKNLMVDLTNYVMLEWGQPMHAFDATKLKRQPAKTASSHSPGVEGVDDVDDVEGVVSLNVEFAQSDVVFKTLDGSELTLNSTDMVVTASGEPVALAGVMGGQTTEVSDESDEYVIEFADFNPRAVGATAKHHRLHSESSFRFERGVDGAAMHEVVRRVMSLLHVMVPQAKIYQPVEVVAQVKNSGTSCQQLDGRTCTNLAAAYPRRHVALRVDRARKYLGLSKLAVERCKDILDGLECELVDCKGSRLVVAIPSHRHDLQREVDLIEEVGRLVGYENIPSSFPTVDPRRLMAREHPALRIHEHLRVSLSEFGLNEVVVYPVGSAADDEACGLDSHHPLSSDFKLLNPLGEQDLLPGTLTSSMLRTLAFNRARHNHNTRMFQLGRGYFRVQNPLIASQHPLSWWRESPVSAPTDYRQSRASHHRTGNNTEQVTEKSLLSILIDPPFGMATLSTDDELGAGFYLLKQLLEAVWDSVGLAGAVSYHSLAQVANGVPFLHPAQAAVMGVGDVMFGYCGLLHPSVAHKWGLGLDGACVLAEVQVDTLAHLVLNQPPKSYTAPSKYPPCLRDLALVVPAETEVAVVHAAMVNYPHRRYFKHAELFDVFGGDQLGEDKKSLAFRLSFVSHKSTLKDRQVDHELEGLCAFLAAEYGFVRRTDSL